MAGLQPRFQLSGLVSVALVVGSFVGFAYSAYLTYLEAFVIHAWCQWCVISAILMTIIFLASIPEARRLRGSQ
jgi:uncharacterized membrane protein